MSSVFIEKEKYTLNEHASVVWIQNNKKEPSKNVVKNHMNKDDVSKDRGQNNYPFWMLIKERRFLI